MGYMKIPNLYKDRDILLFKECYAMEKIHGTSANISYNNGEIRFFSGGVSYDDFVKLFDKDELIKRFGSSGVTKCIVYGEAYGGKCQKMADTYGNELRFIAFEVKIEDKFLNVPSAERFVKNLGLDFVWYTKVPTDITLLDDLSCMNSKQAIRNLGIMDKKAEGIVLRPLIEVVRNNGTRIIAKHKNPDFRETKTIRKLDEKTLKLLTEAKAIANEWVTPMRLNHVLDKLGNPTDMKDVGKVIKEMINDIYTEGEGEIVKNKLVNKEIGRLTREMYVEYLKQNIGIENIKNE